MWLMCPECRDESVFEQPPCEDGHGHDCPEWYCVACGFAVFAGGWDTNPEAIASAISPAAATVAPVAKSRRQRVA
jgi:hypothetical protein